MSPLLLFLKAAYSRDRRQGNLFDAPVMVAGHTTKQGGYIAPYASTRKKRLLTDHQAGAPHLSRVKTEGTDTKLFGASLAGVFRKYGGSLGVVKLLAAEKSDNNRQAMIQQLAQRAGVDVWTLRYQFQAIADRNGIDFGDIEEPIKDEKPSEAEKAPERTQSQAEGTAPAFEPTHELADGTPVRPTGEPDTYVDEHGDEYEDAYASPLGQKNTTAAQLEPSDIARALRAVSGEQRLALKDRLLAQRPDLADSIIDAMDELGTGEQRGATTQQEGDTKTENGAEYVLHDGRWHRAMGDVGADAGLLRQPTASEIVDATPKPKVERTAPAPLAYQPIKDTKHTRQDAKTFYGTGTTAEMDKPSTEIAKLMRADIAKGVKAGRIPKGVKVSIRKNRRSIDILVTGVPEGMTVIDPDHAILEANHPNQIIRYIDARAVYDEVGKHASEVNRYAPDMQRVLDDLKAIHGKYNWDHSDLQSDYFSVNYYGDASVDWELERASSAPNPSESQLGEVITLGGKQYQLTGEPPRWHRVGLAEERANLKKQAEEQKQAAIKSQKDAARKLREAGQKLIDAGQAEHGKDRMTNTHRRASIAERMSKRADQTIARGETMQRMAEAAEKGELQYLGGVRSGKDMELLETLDRRPEWPVMTETAGEWYGDVVKDRQNRLDRWGVTPQTLFAAVEEYRKFKEPVKSKQSEGDRLRMGLVGSKIPGFFPTPPVLVDRMLQQADIQPGQKVLEPSAGAGNLANAIRGYGVDPDVAEVSSTLRDILLADGHKLVSDDFLEMQHADYDRIIMNPPFENGQDMQHTQHAYSLLKPGGKMVAIVSEGPFFRTDKASEQFRQWLNDVGAEVEDVAAGTFNDRTQVRTTGVKSRMVVIEKPEGTQAPRWLAPASSQHGTLRRAKPPNARLTGPRTTP